MNSPTSSEHQEPELPSSSSSLSQISHLKQALTTCSSLFHNFSVSFTNHLHTHLPNFASNPLKSLPFARIEALTQYPGVKQKGGSLGMSNEAIEERLGGVFVYALSNSEDTFTLISGKKSNKSLGLFCMKEEDAESLLDQMKSMDPTMRRGAACVLPVALKKVFQLKVNGVAFRLIPEAIEVKNALKEREKAGESEEEFIGVPVFQSRSLVLRSGEKSYRPVFFRKEDLEKSLSKASKQQGRLNPILRQGDIEVAALEDIIKGMKDDSSKRWDDVVFIPPGFDVLTDPTQSHESPAK